MKTEIFVLTHKEIEEPYDKELYKPLICGAHFNKTDCGYLKDNSGDNISNLNSIYAELTGMYWAWKNEDSDIIGFCHYRRWFVRDLSFNKLNKEDIEEILDNYDVILPVKDNFINKNQSSRYISFLNDIGANFLIKDFFEVTKKVIKEKTPDYLDAFESALSDNKFYHKNMFISNKQLANDFLEWYFLILENVRLDMNLPVFDVTSADFNITLYKPLAYLGEILTDTYMKKNNFKIKELPLKGSECRSYLLLHLSTKYSLIKLISNKMYKILFD